MAVVRPTQAYLKKTLHFFSYRIKAHKQLLAELFPPTAEASEDVNTLIDNQSCNKKWEDNIASMRSLIKTHNLFKSNTTNRGLLNVFSGIQATNEQTHDLVNDRKMGHEDYLNYITHHILQCPSVANAPVRRTMAPSKVKRQKLISLQEKEEREVNKCIRRRLDWCNQTGKGYDISIEQYTLLPRALADVNGIPHKGNKSNWTKKLQNQYNLPDCTPFISCLEWTRHSYHRCYVFSQYNTTETT